MHLGGLVMGLSKYRLGELIELHTVKNTDLQYGIPDVRGVNNLKQLMPTKADLNGRDLTKFQIVSSDEFVFNHRTSRNGSKFSIAYNDDKPIICTEDYVVFRIKDEYKNILNARWLYMLFARPEFDRYVITNSWGSSTEFYNWEDICSIKLDLPSIDIQQKYVDVYNAMLANQQSYERGLEDLKLTCDAYIDKLKHKRTLVEIGDFIQQINNKNIDNQKYRFAGLSMDNYFIDSIADDTELDFTKYKIVEPNEYGAVLMKVGRDARLTIARNTSNERYLISPAYYTFRITGIMPEYFMACVNRPEFERRGWFSCDTSARGSLSWGEFMKLKIPNATDEEQSIISELYKVQVIRIGINEKLKTQIKDLCPILIKGSIEEASR